MIHKRWTFVAFLFSIQWLSACGPITIRDTETQAFIPIQGWSLELHQDLVIPPGRTRVFLQEGRLVYAINELKPHCQLRVREISEQAQSVTADRFTIENVFGTLDQVVTGGHIRLVSAAATVVAGGGGGNGNGESRQMYLYFMGLHADTQPNVSFLVCGGALDDPALADYPTLQEIRVSMGDYATLTLP